MLFILMSNKIEDQLDVQCYLFFSGAAAWSLKLLGIMDSVDTFKRWEIIECITSH